LQPEKFLRTLSEATGVSGYEQPVADLARNGLSEYSDDLRLDKLGNLIALKMGESPDKEQAKPKVMLAAHMDEIGLMVTKIEDEGFIRFASVGGIDQRTLLAQEVIVHGRRDLQGVIGAKPPHVQDPDERSKSVPVEDLFIDVGMSGESVRGIVKVGDVITLNRKLVNLANRRMAGKAFDDRAGVVVLLECLKQLRSFRHTADVYAVATVQEEVGVRGAIVSAYGILPDIGIAIDVGHGDMMGVPEHKTIGLGKGPGICKGPQVHPRIYERLVEVAKEWNIDYSIEVASHPGGTDAYAIQVARTGVPSALISIPLRYMHTSVETLDESDIKASGRLLAAFIASVDAGFVGGLKCY